MNRPYVICHMVTSLDGKVTGKFLSEPQCEHATEYYYQLNRDFKADAFACGRITMEGSFTGGWYPDLSQYEPARSPMDYLVDELYGFYAVAFDPHGRLGWRSSTIIDEDPGYGGAQIIEVLTHQVSGRYLTYLQSMDIPYISLILSNSSSILGIIISKTKIIPAIVVRVAYSAFSLFIRS